ncbi:pantoate--beta-alanine ligase [Hydrogenivirga sp. 128-5-R1-1]|uniref:pantoate--beta-alanine ligase n=1 Tax=Hydrogenivirga sp. 128-5-R1-1 TaxID=392423 RepID=UPI00015EF8F3|nr:pantoate--beta-alanine ligase [Hydrogenivirga sp. 128-5-R1-1]EDP74537.1 pantothenate synthetase [Hydrogenivirga sp. 128-5-R1-1]
MPLLFRKVKELRNHLHTLRCERNASLGFVPTMGYLHEGHRALMERARLQNDITVVSIYVNPTQFGEGEDYERYPRDLERDMAVCEEAGIDVVFAPTDKEVYPPGSRTEVYVRELSEVLEGKFRPGHFKGVATVVTKLLNAVQPDRAYFGEKDYQQLKLIQRLVKDLLIPVEIVPVETVREPDGLAYSSRNVYLSPEERESALSIYRAFLLAQEMINQGERSSDTIKGEMERFILSHPHVKKIDYIEITDPDLNPKGLVDRGDRILVALWVGSSRLIDNWKVL